MNGETDFGLFEILLILGVVGVGIYFLYKTFSGSSSCCSTANKAANAAAAKILSQKLGISVSACDVAAAKKQIQGCCAAPGGPAGSCTNLMGLNTCCLSWWQKAWNGTVGSVAPSQKFQNYTQVSPTCKQSLAPTSAMGSPAGGGCCTSTRADLLAADPYICCDF